MNNFIELLKWKKLKNTIITISIIIGVTILLCLQSFIYSNMNEREAQKTANLLLDEVCEILYNENNNNEALEEALKETYIIRATNVSHIIDYSQVNIQDFQELQKMSLATGVDEINIFDKEGVLIGGSNPTYYGMTMNDGEQISFFKPLLLNRSLKLCQDITPNTKNAQLMIYASTWNTDLTKIIQVGIQPVRMNREMKKRSINDLVQRMPIEKNIQIIVTKGNTICGATKSMYVNNDIKELLNVNEITNNFYCTINNINYFTVVRNYNDYQIILLQDVEEINFLQSTSFVITTAYILVFLIIIYLMCQYFNTHISKSEEEKESIFNVLHSMSQMFATMHLFDLTNNTVKEYMTTDNVRSIATEGDNACEKLYKVLNALVIEEQKNQALDFVNLFTLSARLKNQKSIYRDFISKNIGWFRATFIVIERVNDNPTKVLFVTNMIDEEKKKENELILASNTDELTGVYNRRAYDNDIAHLPDNYIYVALDVNGLKVINDTLGHEAGDELIIGATNCIKHSLGLYGKIYRTGGDEFVAIINTNNLSQLQEDFLQACTSWKGTKVDKLSISAGYVKKSDFPDKNVNYIAEIADDRMYKDKIKHYALQGIDRRGQQDAHAALCKLYNKILMVNLTTDSHKIINMSKENVGISYSDVFSEWITIFGHTQVFDEDKEYYFKYTDVKYLKEYFKQEESIIINYRRLINNNYVRVYMEMIKAKDYSDNNQTLYLYVRQLDV